MVVMLHRDFINRTQDDFPFFYVPSSDLHLSGYAYSCSRSCFQSITDIAAGQGGTKTTGIIFTPDKQRENCKERNHHRVVIHVLSPPPCDACIHCSFQSRRVSFAKQVVTADLPHETLLATLNSNIHSDRRPTSAQEERAGRTCSVDTEGQTLGSFVKIAFSIPKGNGVRLVATLRT